MDLSLLVVAVKERQTFVQRAELWDQLVISDIHQETFLEVKIKFN